MQQRHVRVSKQMAHVLRHAPPKGEGRKPYVHARGIAVHRSAQTGCTMRGRPSDAPHPAAATAAHRHPSVVLMMTQPLCLWCLRAALHNISATPRLCKPCPAEMDSAGFVPLPALLRELRAPGVCEELVRSIVAADSKGRYQLDESSAPPRIRAVQGHSVQLAAPELQAVSSADQVPLALHVTSAEGWAGIQVGIWISTTCVQHCT